MTTENLYNTNQIDWNDVIKKEARGTNDYNLGEVKDVNTCYIHTQKGTLSQTHYYIPRNRVTNYDGKTLNFNISEDEGIEFKGLKQPSEEDCELKYEAQVTKQEDLATKPLVFPETNQTRDLTDIVERIPIMTQRLDVNKHTIKEEATITKVPYLEKQTKEIPVTREILTIERVTPSQDRLVTDVRDRDNVNVSGTTYTSDTQGTRTVRDTTDLTDRDTMTVKDRSTTADNLSPQVIKITLEHEAVDVTKTPVVKEELIVRKRPVTETVHVAEDIRSERVETSENIRDAESETRRRDTSTTESARNI